MPKPLRFPNQAPPPAPRPEVTIAEHHAPTEIGFSVRVRRPAVGDCRLDVVLARDARTCTLRIDHAPTGGWAIWIAQDPAAPRMEVVATDAEAWDIKLALVHDVRRLIGAGWRVVRDTGLGA